MVTGAAAVRAMIGLAGQYAAVDPFLTGRENLELVAELRHLPPGERRRDASLLLERLGLAGAAGRLARTYSGGMRRRLDLAAALIGHPRVLFLDEPTTGLDPRSRRELWDLIGEQARARTTVLLTTQYMIAAFLAASKAGLPGGKGFFQSADKGIDVEFLAPDGRAIAMEAKTHYVRGYRRRDGTFVAPHLARSPRGVATVARRRLVVFLEWYAAIRLLLIVLRLSGRAVSGLTGLAVLLAGRKRAALRDEWRAHLAGESGHDPASWQKARQAAGFLISAIRYRCSDAAGAAWTLADAILRSRRLSNLVVIAPAVAAAYLVLWHEGTLGLVESAESIGAIGGTLYALIQTGRWWRNVKPPEPKASRTKV